MKIILTSEYKSLQKFESCKLSDFSVITGKNGSGKSQLLDLINKKFSNLNSGEITDIELEPQFQIVQYEGIVKNKSNSVNRATWNNIIDQKIKYFKQLKKYQLQVIIMLLEDDIYKKFNFNETKEFLINTDEYRDLALKAYKEHSNADHIPDFNYGLQNVTLRQILKPEFIKAFNFALSVSKYTGKNLEHLEDSDFYRTPYEEFYIDENDLFSSKIELIFFNYIKRRHENDYKNYQKERNGADNNAVSDKEFIENNLTPWGIINTILEKNSLEYYFKEIPIDAYSPEGEVSLDIKLYKTDSDTPIPFENLSSGEQVIIGLILKMFVTEFYGDNLSYPDLIMLDEPDAHLHPEMSNLLLNVLRNTFVEKFGIKVLMTTHSPSTIALCPEDSIYQLKNHHNSSLEKVTKDEALRMLTGFIPTLSLDYHNHKQIFVESPTDVQYFQILHEKLQQSNDLTNKLYFISNSMGEGNCDQVKKVVSDLRESGNRTSYGIIDWDLKNKSEEFTMVHGLDERYSIENFLLDPIYLIILMIEYNNAHSICSELGISPSDNQYLVLVESEDKIQYYSNYIFDKITSRFPGLKDDGELIAIHYHNFKKTNWPKWYAHMQGHELEEKLRTTFTALSGFRNEGELQKKLSIIMGKSYPFVSNSSVELLKSL